MLIIPGILASQRIAAGDYESIATVTVGSGGAANVEFTSIPATYKHLQVRFMARTNRALTVDYLKLQFNADTAANYNDHSLYGNGANAAASAATSTNWISALRAAGANAGSNIFGVGVIDILDYGDSNKYKTTRNLGGIDNNGDGDIYFQSGLWRSTSAITSLKLTVGGGTTINQYSSFALYGVKG